jgi:hypothetical protein
MLDELAKDEIIKFYQHAQQVLGRWARAWLPPTPNSVHAARTALTSNDVRQG